jgi:hypothetical protein
MHAVLMQLLLEVEAAERCVGGSIKRAACAFSHAS